ncbi:NAD(P)-dependent dehydrogenase, short-chain alcohol dehydrogenase family [Chitinophaga rupis]|uniref:NAD(P)-dependent dehydrogenase, short-chain alcohol dehydrogenase family n=1 Tax=Chitinophaga rupis TaxID=573321 RepID=A0A1H7LSZ2_9BACT|nr:short chain dehydrogenase [Chitinophaga rupis]SEL02081.1 NAD(P)-dependent dehydrogenase, short-chain alcohol dehydrogenase family [Chitinophaga rupis]
MKVILIGATGILGKNILAALKQYAHLEVVTVARKGGADLTADISSLSAIKEMYAAVGKFDAVICAAGDAYIGPFDTMTEENMYTGIKGKMMGQINLVMAGKDLISDKGSFTLTSGFISDDPVKGTINYAMVNGAIDNFVQAATIELERGIRINAVSPGWVVENYDGKMDTPPIGQYPVPIDKVVHAYYKSAFGYLTGQVFRVWEPSTQYVRK